MHNVLPTLKQTVFFTVHILIKSFSSPKESFNQAPAIVLSKTSLELRLHPLHLAKIENIFVLIFNDLKFYDWLIVCLTFSYYLLSSFIYSEIIRRHILSDFIRWYFVLSYLLEKYFFLLTQLFNLLLLPLYPMLHNDYITEIFSHLNLLLLFVIERFNVSFEGSYIHHYLIDKVVNAGDLFKQL